MHLPPGGSNVCPKPTAGVVLDRHCSLRCYWNTWWCQWKRQRPTVVLGVITQTLILDEVVVVSETLLLGHNEHWTKGLWYVLEDLLDALKSILAPILQRNCR